MIAMVTTGLAPIHLAAFTAASVTLLLRTLTMEEAYRAVGWRAIVASAGGGMVHEVTRVDATHVTLPLATKNPLRMQRNVGRLGQLFEVRLGESA